MKAMQNVIGLPILPPIFSLGFHYSKWEKEITASKLAEWNYEFTRFKFPVDSFWLDISHTPNYQYFSFDPVKFPTQVFDIAKAKIAEAGRQIVVITDPHLSVDPSYLVYHKM
jgi:alpha-glucosidase (family GH31 glycosyl hydrolase)